MTQAGEGASATSFETDLAPEAQPLSFDLNGETVHTEAEPGEQLLEVLRERLGSTSAKDGCMPQGQCGACTVLIDGKPRLSCNLEAQRVAGKLVTTLEGLSAERRELLTEAFVRAGGLQCGYCIPGIVMRAHTLLERMAGGEAMDRARIARLMDISLCRCTGYVKILDAIELAARHQAGEAWPPEDVSGLVGTGLRRYQGVELAFGELPYINDMVVDGLLHGALRLSDHPRARVVRIDTARAAALAGVERVITWRDVPGQRFQGLITRDWPVLVAEGEETRYVGDVIAAVAAKTRRLARRAAALIEVEYEVLEPVLDPEQALEPGAPRLHPQGNLLSRSETKKGDAVAALAASAHVVEESFHTQFIEHAYLEPESALAVPVSDGSMCVYTPGQGVFDDRRQLASLLARSLESVRVELVPNGGAFGGKEDLGVQGPAVLLAEACQQPVRVTLSRDESIRCHPKRHPITMHYQVGCDAEGRLTAVRARMIGDKGAYASVGAKVLERACGHSTGAYRVPNVDVEALAVYTNNLPCGAMRGFGANQAAFAIEGCLDRLAEKVGLDGWEIRWRNALAEGDRFGTGQKLSSVGLKKSLEAVKPAWDAAKFKGIACGIKNVGIGNGMPDDGEAVLEVRAGGRVWIHTGFTEMGQGLFTVLIQVACTETGLPPDVFDVQASTDWPTPCGMTTASRGTVLGGNAVRAAARKLKSDLDGAGGSLTALAGRTYLGEYRCHFTTKLGDDDGEPVTHLTYGYATQVVILDDQGAVSRVVAAHDVGKVMNPVLLEGQIEGSVHMGLGFSLTEELPTEGGRPTTTQIGKLGVLRFSQMPDVEVIFVEEHEPHGPYGAKGVGEIGLVPTAGATAGALWSFDKVWRNRLPMKDSPAAQAMVGRKRSPPARAPDS